MAGAGTSSVKPAAASRYDILQQAQQGFVPLPVPVWEKPNDDGAPLRRPQTTRVYLRAMNQRPRLPRAHPPAQLPGGILAWLRRHACRQDCTIAAARQEHSYGITSSRLRRRRSRPSWRALRRWARHWMLSRVSGARPCGCATRCAMRCASTSDNVVEHAVPLCAFQLSAIARPCTRWSARRVR
jgi:hypothetical protein